MKFDYQRQLLFYCLIILLSLVACAPNDQSTNIEVTENDVASTPVTEDDQVLKLFLWQAPDIVNPHLASGTKDLFVSRILYEPLASYNADGVLQPILATDIPDHENGGLDADSGVITWVLRDDVRWADGEAFTADDVLFTYEYLTKPDYTTTSKFVYRDIESIEIIDDYTIQFTMVNGLANWNVPFVGLSGLILPRHLFENETASNPLFIGTGAYYIEDFVTEDVLLIGGDAVNIVRVDMLPNPYYREAGQPYFDRVEIRGGGGDANFAAQAILDGQTDFSWNVVADESYLDEIEEQEDIDLLIYSGSTVERIMFNFTDPDRESESGERSSIELPHPFLTEDAVRQAIFHAIDRDAIETVYGRLGQSANGIIVLPEAFSSEDTGMKYDPELSDTLLTDAGWLDDDGDGVRERDGIRLEIVYQTSVNSIRQQIQDIVKDNLEAVGFDVELRGVDASVFFNSAEDLNNNIFHFYADIQQYAEGNTSPNPSYYMGLWTCDTRAQQANDWNGGNIARYCNEDYDRLYAEALANDDPTQRDMLFSELNAFLIENTAVVPLFHYYELSAFTNDLSGFEPTPWDMQTWNIASWERRSSD